MKTIIRSLCVVVGVMFLGGCYISRNGYICYLTSPELYCDKELYERASNVSRLVDDWESAGHSEQERMRDWMSCGGGTDGSYLLAPLPSGKQRTTLQSNNDAQIVVHDIQRCMMRKHYRYTGQCTTSITRLYPPCQSREES